MSKKVKPIQLSGVGRTMKEVWLFRKQLISNLGDDIFSFETMQELIFNALKLISPTNRTVKLNDSSIEEACSVILKHFGLDRKVTVRHLTANGDKEIKSDKKSNATTFCEQILDIDKLPSNEYEKLRKEVNKDLLSISELIKWYESQAPVQNYLKENRTSESSQDRKLCDFYKRCILERVEIINYLLYELKNRTLAKSRYSNWVFGGNTFYSLFNGKPYQYGQPFARSYFDCREMDLVGHRIGEFYIDEANSLEKLYKLDKAGFYRKYFKKTSVQKHFQDFTFYLEYLPLEKNRKPIFDELIRLFKGKRWISFYALALPQIEGLFSEMCLVFEPEKDLSQKSLTHKVSSLRQFGSLTNSDFDYYQYQIPVLRNKFAHTGHEEDFKLKSFDLLVDLTHLLKVFSELDNPLVKIKRLHTRRNFEDFAGVTRLVEYIKLLDALEPKQVKKLSADIERFEKEFLIKYCEVDYVCLSVIQELQQKLDEVVAQIDSYFIAHKHFIDFETVNKPQLDNLFKDEKLTDIMRSCFLQNISAFDTLENYYFIVSRCDKYFPSVRTEIKSELKKLNTEHGGILKNIMAIKSRLIA